MEGWERLEENELGWFSLWSDRIELEGAILLVNEAFSDDPLFNHAYLKEGLKPKETLEDIAKQFRGRGVRPCIYLKQGGLRKRLMELGYRLYDELIVMENHELEGLASKEIGEVEVVKVNSSSLNDWVRAFSGSFELPSSWENEVKERAGSCLNRQDTALYLGYKGDRLGGALALFLKDEVAGIYCVGTLPSMRRRGIATAMIASVAREARRLGAMLMCLQTLAVDRLEGFYSRLGFRRAYVKEIYLMG